MKRYYQRNYGSYSNYDKVRNFLRNQSVKYTLVFIGGFLTSTFMKMSTDELKDTITLIMGSIAIIVIGVAIIVIALKTQPRRPREIIIRD